MQLSLWSDVTDISDGICYDLIDLSICQRLPSIVYVNLIKSSCNLLQYAGSFI